MRTKYLPIRVTIHFTSARKRTLTFSDIISLRKNYGGNSIYLLFLTSQSYIFQNEILSYIFLSAIKTFGPLVTRRYFSGGMDIMTFVLSDMSFLNC